MSQNRISYFIRALLSVSFSVAGPLPVFAQEATATATEAMEHDAPDRLCLGDVNTEADVITALRKCTSDSLNDIYLRVKRLKSEYEQTERQIRNLEEELNPDFDRRFVVLTGHGLVLTAALTFPLVKAELLGMDAEWTKDHALRKQLRRLQFRYRAIGSVASIATLTSAILVMRSYVKENEELSVTMTAKVEELAGLKAHLHDVKTELERRETIIQSLIQKQNRRQKLQMN
jgi:hypothetical protein